MENNNSRWFEVVSSYAGTDVVLPRRGSGMSAGYDFYNVSTVTIEPKEKVLLPTGVKAYMDSDETLIMTPRSSISKRQDIRIDIGIIDADYVDNQDNEGEIMVSLENLSDNPVVFGKGERLVQGVFTKYLVTKDDNPQQVVRSGGIGSTGV